MIQPQADTGSFRDPRGRVYRLAGEVYRTVSDKAIGDFEFAQKTGLLDDLMAEGKLVPTEVVDSNVLGEIGTKATRVLRHQRIPFISYPYEWPFSLLKAAALLHLDIQIEALKRDVTLSDASAYNVQFLGVKPVFIDVLSFRPYREGEIWAGHRQFCEQFLNPLLLRSLFGIAHNDWYRGRLEGIPTSDLADLLPWWRNLSFNVLTHVTLQARLQRAATGDDGSRLERAKKATLPRRSYAALLEQLRSWIEGLKPSGFATVWQDYTENTTYQDEERSAKHRAIATFCRDAKPQLLWDLGCNTGDYSETALAAGVQRVIGFDLDHGALEGAVQRAKEKSLSLLPLYQDGANPSPDQGWMGTERGSPQHRGCADALIALAFEHHLAIGRNVPLNQLVKWLVSLAPKGVVEFVQKSDPTVQKLLALREDIFTDYGADTFEAALKSETRILWSEQVSRSGRTLYAYERV